MIRNFAAVLFLILFIGTISVNTLAQDLEIDCGDDVVIRNGVDIQFPNIERNDTHSITVLGIGEYDSVLAVFNEQQNGDCNDDAEEAALYSASLPTTDFVNPSELNAQMTLTNNYFMRVVIGEFEDLDGEVLLVVEGLTYNGTPDLINLTVTNDMIQSGIPVTAYVIERTEGLDLSLAVVDDNGVPLLDDTAQSVECDDAGDQALCWGAHVPLTEAYISTGLQTTAATAISPMLSIPLSANDVGNIVPFQIRESAESETDMTGEYVFLLHFGLGEVAVADGLASTTTTPDGISLSCDNEEILSDPIEITIPRVDAPYTVSVIAKDNADPMIAIMDSVGGGICYMTSENGDELYAELPILEGFNRSIANAQAGIITENARILTGLVNDGAGSYLLVINGLNIPPDGTPDVVSVNVTESMVASGEPVSAFMIANDLDLNSRLALVSAEQEILTSADGLPIVCTNTDQPDMCWGDYADMGTAEVGLGVDDKVLGISNDVMLRIPLTTDHIGTTLNFMADGAEGTSGDYVLILHLPTGIQPEPAN